jgi:hypothetical protein
MNMPKRMFALEQKGEKRLAFAWTGSWSNLTISLDGKPVGEVALKKDLMAGRQFNLADGSLLDVRLVNNWNGTEFRVLRNGKPVPGSATDPHARIRRAALAIYFIGALNIGLGALTLILQASILNDLGIGWISLAGGGAFLLLGFLVQRRLFAALVIALALYVLDGLFGIGFTLTLGRMPNITMIIVRVLLIIPMLTGIGAMRTLRRAKKNASLPSLPEADNR